MQLQVLYKQLGVTVNSIMPARTLQDGGVGFDTMLIGFSLDLSAPQSCPAVRIKPISVLAANYGYFCLHKKAITVSQPKLKNKSILAKSTSQIAAIDVLILFIPCVKK